MTSTAYFAQNFSSQQIKDLQKLLSKTIIRKALINYVRVGKSKYLIQNAGNSNSGPLSVGSGSSRFGPAPNVKFKTKFGVLYIAQTLGTAAYETIVRDQLDGQIKREIGYSHYSGRIAVPVSSANITLLDLTGNNAITHGVPTDVLKYSKHDDGRYFSQFVYNHMHTVEGIIYPSRFTYENCVAVYDRGIAKLTAQPNFALNRSVLNHALKTWKIKTL